jgi:carbon storage regulator
VGAVDTEVIPMLVLSRLRDETVVLDFSQACDKDIERLRSGAEVIEVMLVDIRGEKVRTGYEAPKSIQVHRKEVWVALQKESKVRMAAAEPYVAGKGAPR